MTVVISTDSDEDIKAKIAENQVFLDELESGRVHIGHPAEGRTEAKIAQLRRDNAMYQSILDKRHSPAEFSRIATAALASKDIDEVEEAVEELEQWEGTVSPPESALLFKLREHFAALIADDPTFL